MDDLICRSHFMPQKSFSPLVMIYSIGNNIAREWVKSLMMHPHHGMLHGRESNAQAVFSNMERCSQYNVGLKQKA